MEPEEYEAKIAELEEKLQKANEQKNEDSFEELKTKYENIISEKDEKISELENTVKNSQKKIDDTVAGLNNEVKEKLEQTEAYKELQQKLAQLEKERAEATVDAYIQKGILLPKQKESAVKICLKDNEEFLNLYRDAKPIVETENKRKSIPTGTAERIANYLNI